MMTFPQAIATVFRKYAEFEGRARRPEFWWWVLFTTLVNAALNSLNVVAYSVGSHGEGFQTVTTGYGSGLAGLWGIAVLLPTLAVAVRRLRDAGRRWPELFWILLPIVGLIILIVHLADPSRPDDAVAASPAAVESGAGS